MGSMYPSYQPISGESPASAVARWEAYSRTVEEAFQGAAGFEREKLNAQRQDAQAGLKNALAIANLQAQTSRYATDTQYKTAMAQLKQDQVQFEARHALDMQRFGLEQQQTGLDAARTGTEYLSTPDRWFQAGDFMSMAGRALNGQGPSPYAQSSQPVPKTEADWNTFLNSFTPNSGAQQVSSGSNSTTGTPGTATVASGANGQAQTETPDPRTKLLADMMKGLPPSQSGGMDEMDFAVLNAAKALYSAPLRPGTYQKMRPGQQAMLDSAGRRLGYSPEDWKLQTIRNGVGQGSNRSY